MLKGRLVLKVLGKHFSIISPAIPQKDIKTRPYGALCVAIQAVCTAVRRQSLILIEVAYLGTTCSRVHHIRQDRHPRLEDGAFLGGELGRLPNGGGE